MDNEFWNKLKFGFPISKRSKEHPYATYQDLKTEFFISQNEKFVITADKRPTQDNLVKVTTYKKDDYFWKVNARPPIDSLVCGDEIVLFERTDKPLPAFDEIGNEPINPDDYYKKTIKVFCGLVFEDRGSCMILTDKDDLCKYKTGMAYEKSVVNAKIVAKNARYTLKEILDEFPSIENKKDWVWDDVEYNYLKSKCL